MIKLEISDEKIKNLVMECLQTITNIATFTQVLNSDDVKRFDEMYMNLNLEFNDHDYSYEDFVLADIVMEVFDSLNDLTLIDTVAHMLHGEHIDSAFYLNILGLKSVYSQWFDNLDDLAEDFI